MNNFSLKSKQGVVAVYMALIVSMIMISGALAVSGILSRQVRFAADNVTNEQAFYLADSGTEALLYTLKSKIDGGDTSLSTVNGTIDYPGQTGTFNAKGRLMLTPDLTRTIDCVESEGAIKTESRRVAIGPDSCSLQ